MASPVERTRNNVRAGIFVSLAVILAVFTVVAVSGAWESVFRATRHYAVRYTVSAGVSDIARGAAVRVGGVNMGRVEAVRPFLVADEPFEFIDIDFELDNDIRLYADARIYVSTPILGSDAWLEVSSVGAPEAGEPAGGRLVGAVTTGLLQSVIGAENAARTDEILENAEQFTEFLSGVPQEYRERVVPSLDDMKATTSRVRALAERAEGEDWPRWAASVDEVLAWTIAFTEDLDAAAAEGHELLRDSRAVVAENRPKIDAIVENTKAGTEDVKEITARLRTETVDKVNAMFERGREALDTATAAIERMRTDYQGWNTNLAEALANANLASQQLKLATIEVRRSPWKLLYRPGEKEIEHELLYDAARSFALASADLKAAAATVQSILDRHQTLAQEDPELAERLRQNLLDPLRNYETAQRRLLDVLLMEE